jgi:hypothetical protein
MSFLTERTQHISSLKCINFLPLSQTIEGLVEPYHLGDLSLVVRNTKRIYQKPQPAKYIQKVIIISLGNKNINLVFIKYRPLL